MFTAGAFRGWRTPNVNFGPPIISEAITAKMLKFKMQLDMIDMLRVYFSARGV